MNHHDSNPFFNVPETNVATSAGPLTLPIAYYDASNEMAIFSVDADVAEKKLAGTGLQPLLFSGKASTAMTFFRYRDTSAGPYNEVGLALYVVPEGSELAGFHILNLPVTTTLAKAAGCELWGYPKFVTELPIESKRGHYTGSVVDAAGQLIMELSGVPDEAAGDEVPSREIVTYSILDGQLLRTTIATRGTYRTSGGGNLKLTLGDSPHPMAANLRDLNLAGKTPLRWQTSDNFQSLLYPGEPC